LFLEKLTTCLGRFYFEPPAKSLQYLMYYFDKFLMPFVGIRKKLPKGFFYFATGCTAIAKLQ